MKRFQEKDMLLIEPCAGMGNRLRAIASAMYWAEKLDKKLIIVWKQEDPCACDYRSIFGKEWEKYFWKKQYIQMSKRNGRIIRSAIDSYGLKRIHNMYDFISNEERETIWNRGGECAFEQRIIGTNSVYIKATDYFCLPENATKHLKKITFSPKIYESVNSVFRSYASKRVIGVHIRRTDHQGSIQNSPTALFIQIMDSIKNSSEEVYFYVATDDLSEEKVMNERYHCIKHNRLMREKVSRICTEGIVDAMVDMLCLANCEKYMLHIIRLFPIAPA